MTPTSKAYGNQDTGTDSAFETVHGDQHRDREPDDHHRPTLTGTDAGQFNKGTDTCTGAIGGARGDLHRPGPVLADHHRSQDRQLRFAHNAAGTPSDVALTGTGTTPVTPDVLGVPDQQGLRHPGHRHQQRRTRPSP